MMSHGFLQLTVILPSLLLGLTLHECAHAWMANRCGDSTARLMGRLTLNPIAHLDWVGALLMLVVGFGWGKPVPVNPGRLIHPRRDSALVSLAGPLSNLGLAIAIGVVLRAWGTFAEQSWAGPLPRGLAWLFCFLAWALFLNLLLAVFNLIPVPPLDGSKILASLISGDRWTPWMEGVTPHSTVLLVLLVTTGVYRWIADPVADLACRVLVHMPMRDLMALANMALTSGGAGL